MTIRRRIAIALLIVLGSVAAALIITGVSDYLSIDRMTEQGDR